MRPKFDRDASRVLAAQGETVLSERDKARAVGHEAEDAISRSESLIRHLGDQPGPYEPAETSKRTSPPPLRSWEEIVADAGSQSVDIVEVRSLLSDADAERVHKKLQGWSSEFADLHRLRSDDLVIAGISGALAGIADIVLVGVPKHPGFLGGPAARGGVLSNAVKRTLSKILPVESVRFLEVTYPVCFDASTSRNLDEPIAGFGPRTHRLQTLGHDPLLGWIFGVRDVLTRQCSAIGSDGRIVIQDVSACGAEHSGRDLFVNLLEALKAVAGHLLSDVSTAAGLPPPLFALFQLIHTGNFKGRTVADIVRIMYRSGYDFRHFLAGGITTALIEVMVRTAWFIHELPDNEDLSASLPLNQPRLISTLFLAHSIAAGINAGKVMVSQTPLSVNYAQWLAFSTYLARQTLWLAYARENERQKHVRSRLEQDWNLIDRDFQRLWSQTFTEEGSQSNL